MPTHSQVAIAIKESAFPLNRAAGQLLSRATKRLVHRDGVLYFFDEIEWYREVPEVACFLDYLASLDGEQYYLVEACNEYLAKGVDDDGEWYDNPFDLCREIAVTVFYTDPVALDQLDTVEEPCCSRCEHSQTDVGSMQYGESNEPCCEDCKED